MSSIRFSHAIDIQVVTDIPTDLQLRSIARNEVAAFILDIVEGNLFVRQKPFIGRSCS